MAADNIFKGRKFSTQVATAGFVALSAPYTKGGSNDFKCSLRFEDPDEIEEITTLLEGLAVEDKDDRGKKCNLPMTFEEDEETGEPTGVLIVRFKALAGGLAKTGPNAGKHWTHDLIIRQPEEGTIGPGSRLAIQFMVRQTVYQKKHYLQLKPIRVKVVDLVVYEGGEGGGDDGFFDGADGIEVKAQQAPERDEEPTTPPEVPEAEEEEEEEEETPKPKKKATGAAKKGAKKKVNF
jgi:hypothetical protein